MQGADAVSATSSQAGGGTKGAAHCDKAEARSSFPARVGTSPPTVKRSLHELRRPQGASQELPRVEVARAASKASIVTRVMTGIRG